MATNRTKPKSSGYLNHKNPGSASSTPLLPRANRTSRPLPTKPVLEEAKVDEDRQPMLEWQKNILRKNSMLLKKNVYLRDGLILDHLWEKKVLTQSNYETLVNMNGSPPLQMHKLIGMLERNGEDAYFHFTDALKQEGTPDYILERLQRDEAFHRNRLAALDGQHTVETSAENITEHSFIDERDNIYIVTVAATVSVIAEKKIPKLKSNLWDMYTTFLSDGVQYEEIDKLSPVQSKASLNEASSDESLTLGVKEFLKDYVEATKVQLEADEELLLNVDLTSLLVDIFDTTQHGLAYDSQKRLLVVDFSHLRVYGDISSEPWYYPVPVSSKRMTTWLGKKRIKGTYYVYKSSDRDFGGSQSAVYNLSLCHNNNGDVAHYRIVKDSSHELYIADVAKGKEKTFCSIENLVKYFRSTRGCLECRLRWSPPELAEETQYPLMLNPDELVFHEKLTSQNYCTHKSSVTKGLFSDRNVAIKAPSRTLYSKVEEDDFLMEAKVLGQLNHNNIVRLEGICYIKGSYHLVTEYADNNDLYTCLRNGMIDYSNTETMLKLWMQLLQGLVYLKAQTYVIHRDIAARNLLLHGREVLKLSDFGMAVKVEQHDGFIPDKGEIFAIRWAAPEVLIKRIYSTASDIWSAGVVYWEMATGAKFIPYHGLKCNSKVEKRVASGTKLDYSRDMNPSHEHTMKEIVSNCWKKDPKERMAADALLRLCGNYLNTLDGGETLYEHLEPRVKRSKSLRWFKKTILGRRDSL